MASTSVWLEQVLGPRDFTAAAAAEDWMKQEVANYMKDPAI